VTTLGARHSCGACVGGSLRRDATRCASHPLINLGGEAGLGTNTTAHIYFFASPRSTHHHPPHPQHQTERRDKSLFPLSRSFCCSWKQCTLVPAHPRPFANLRLRGSMMYVFKVRCPRSSMVLTVTERWTEGESAV
jgi:hypothetical protein